MKENRQPTPGAEITPKKKRTQPWSYLYKLEVDPRYREFNLDELIEFCFDPKSNDEFAAKAQKILISARSRNVLDGHDIRFFVPIPPRPHYKRMLSYWFATEKD